MILNLNNFNQFLVVPHCKVKLIEDALNLVTEVSHDWSTTPKKIGKQKIVKL